LKLVLAAASAFLSGWVAYEAYSRAFERTPPDRRPELAERLRGERDRKRSA
jgi:hypothetical protein